MFEHAEIEERMGELLARLREEDVATLVHLLACELCRSMVQRLLAPEREDPWQGFLAGELPFPVDPQIHAMEGCRLFEELMDMEPSRRWGAVRQARFRNLLVADLLVEESLQALPADPRRSEEMAALARQVARKAYPPGMKSWVDEILVRSCCVMGNARRLLGDLAGAEERFGAASSALPALPGSPERAFYCQMLAYLREDQNLLEEAANLLWRAATTYRDLGEPVRQGECLCRLGFLFLRRHDMDGAVRTLTRSRLLLLDCSPVFAARAGLGIAVCLAALGQPEPARILLEDSRRLRSAIPDQGELLVLDWLEGRIEAHLGDFAAAVPRLDGVRRRLLEQEKLVETALCTVDLACACARAGRAEEILDLIHELGVRFPGAVDLSRILAALCSLMDAAREGELGLEAAARQAADLIRRPGAPVEN